MNWSRAKTILILIFTILNFILYTGNMKIAATNNTVPTAKEINEMYRILDNNNIKIQTNVPNNYKPMPMLRVKLKNYDKDFIMSNFIKNSKFNSYNGGTTYNIGNETIEVKNGYFYYKIVDDKFKNMDKDTAFDYIKSFVKENNLIEKYSVANATYDGNKYTVEYTEIYNGYNVDVSYMKGVINNGTFSFESTWLIPVEEEKEKREIIHPVNALLKLLEINEGSKITIVKEVKPVYFFSWKDADMGEAIPAWRITTESSTYYINAYTGNIEQR
ncbi:two-component system regulatory protein YycI [Thermoanaerobacterium sp. RBIITD]|uniref:two-component system regulatory protein YycI n=1 Tax=Thermoanaerobacterium sp. RBIITD TaxID=1550240 RepID=UPI000BB6EE6F|nr:two-component system regulatory protein YycI [Thermoanaerobacterium sp. RBIITD]SNX53716.1 Two-component signal transduction system YycFG, regulatory protein YycI [Thermoanaerobacterium sp. RBIITD]